MGAASVPGNTKQDKKRSEAFWLMEDERLLNSSFPPTLGGRVGSPVNHCEQRAVEPTTPLAGGTQDACADFTRQHPDKDKVLPHWWECSGGSGSPYQLDDHYLDLTWDSSPCLNVFEQWQHNLLGGSRSEDQEGVPEREELASCDDLNSLVPAELLESCAWVPR